MDKLTFIGDNLVGLERIDRINQSNDTLPAQHAAEIVGDAQIDNVGAVFDGGLQTEHLMRALYTPSIPDPGLLTSARFEAARRDAFDKVGSMAEDGEPTCKEVMRQFRSMLAASENFWSKLVELSKP